MWLKVRDRREISSECETFRQPAAQVFAADARYRIADALHSGEGTVCCQPGNQESQRNRRAPYQEAAYRQSIQHLRPAKVGKSQIQSATVLLGVVHNPECLFPSLHANIGWDSRGQRHARHRRNKQFLGSRPHPDRFLPRFRLKEENRSLVLAGSIAGIRHFPGGKLCHLLDQAVIQRITRGVFRNIGQHFGLPAQPRVAALADIFGDQQIHDGESNCAAQSECNRRPNGDTPGRRRSSRVTIP